MADIKEKLRILDEAAKLRVRPDSPKDRAEFFALLAGQLAADPHTLEAFFSSFIDFEALDRLKTAETAPFRAEAFLAAPVPADIQPSKTPSPPPGTTESNDAEFVPVKTPSGRTLRGSPAVAPSEPRRLRSSRS